MLQYPLKISYNLKSELLNFILFRKPFNKVDVVIGTTSTKSENDTHIFISENTKWIKMIFKYL